MSTLRFQFSRRWGERGTHAEGSITFGPGAWIHALMGDSGAGKTSFARWVAGLGEGGAGTLHWSGEAWETAGRRASPQERRVALLSQGDALFPHLDIGANIGYSLRRIPAQERARRVAELLSLVGLATRVKSYPVSLSGGEKRRAALAQVLAAKPRLLILDEPFTGLDEGARQALWRDTRAWIEGENLPTLLITHDDDEARALASRVHRYVDSGLRVNGTDSLVGTSM